MEDFKCRRLKPVRDVTDVSMEDGVVAASNFQPQEAALASPEIEPPMSVGYW